MGPGPAMDQYIQFTMKFGKVISSQMHRRQWRQTGRKTPQLDWVTTSVTSLRRDLVRTFTTHTSDPG